MDIRYKSFVPRSKQDHSFDQIMRNTGKFSQSSFELQNSSKPTSFNERSPPMNLMNSNRKKVNVITFTPDESNELIAKAEDKESIDSPTNELQNLESNANNFPVLIRSNSAMDIDNDSEILTQNNNTASKIIAAKRKAAAKDLGLKSVSCIEECPSLKRKFASDTTILPVKRAVSPEILNPEPSIYDIPKLSPPHSSFVKPTNQPDLKRGKPIINFKKSKIIYNPRPWLDEDKFDDEFKLKSENIVYNSKSQTSLVTNNPSNISHSNIASSRVNTTNSYAVSSFKSESVTQQSNSGPNQPTSSYKMSLTSSMTSAHNSSLSKYSKFNYCSKSQSSSDGLFQKPQSPVVLKQVKEAYECQETGETQDLLDDVEYLIEGLKGNIKSSTKTLSIISLISKCLSFSFRNVLKAHGILYKIFNYLSDAYSDDSLAMCTAALFLVFSRDKQPRIFHEDSLKLLMKLPSLNKDVSRPNKDHDRVRDRLRLVLDKLHSNGNSNNHCRSLYATSFNRKCLCCRHMKLDNNITTEDLVVECLLQLSTRKTIDWFKNQMCKLGGVDLICEQIAASVEYLGSDLGPQCLDEFVMDRLYRLFNYMRFLEHMTFQNRDNQSYLIDYHDGVLIFNLWRCLKLCAANLSFQVEGSSEKKLIEACLMAILRLLANISHDNEWASNQLGCCNGLLQLIFSCLLHLPRFMSRGKRFDLSVLALALLINLAEHCSDNRLRMAHITVSRKRVACLGQLGQINNKESNIESNGDCKNQSATHSKMDFGFDDEPEEEDMDLDDEDDNTDNLSNEDLTGANNTNHHSVSNGNPIDAYHAEFKGNNFINFDCDSNNKKINVLEALVKLFLRHDDRARNNTIIEGEDNNQTTTNKSNGKNKTIDEQGSNSPPAIKSAASCAKSDEGGIEEEDEDDPKWRIVQDRGNASRKKKLKSTSHHLHLHGARSELSDESEDDEDEASSDEGADVEFLINSKEEEVELQKKLSAAGQHMQDSVVSAYTALLLGCIIKGSSHYMERIREHLPNGKFKLLAFVLAKFLSILSITSGLGQSGEESILGIVRLLESQDKIQLEENATSAETNSSNKKNITSENFDKYCLESKVVTVGSEKSIKNKLNVSSGGGDILSFSQYCKDNDLDNDSMHKKSLEDEEEDEEYEDDVEEDNSSLKSS